MGDLGFISGMIGYAIQLAGDQIIHHISIAVRCKEELDTLEDLLTQVKALNVEMQEYRKALNSGKIRTSHHALPSAVNKWLERLNDLLQEASDLAQSCTVPSSYHLIPRYRTSKRISRHISLITKHLDSTPSIAFVHQLQQDVANQEGLREITERLHSLKLAVSVPANTSGDCSTSSTQQTPMSRMKYIEEPLILGQDYAYERVEELIESAHHANVSRIGLLGMGGSGKTLVLKRLYNGHQVQNLFSNGFLLWLTVSLSPSLQTLRNELVKQIALQTNVRLESREDEEQIKVWLKLRMEQNKFALFLDDVWETDASSLLEELAVPLFSPTNSNIIFATSRNRRTLLQMGVVTSSIIQMEELNAEHSWKLCSSHAFPCSDGNLPINEGLVMSVCKECRGLPLAIKVIARAMAGITHSKEWESALTGLLNAQPMEYGDVTGNLYGRLRLSYDALADFHLSLQFCFLYLAAFREDEVIHARLVSMHWIGEGLLAGDNPLQIAQDYVNLLADRCLIEATFKDIEGNVLSFRVHDVLYDLARQISVREENCFFPPGKHLQEFPSNDCSKKVRISLRMNSLTSIPSTFRAPHIRSWVIFRNPLEEIPKQVIGSMIYLTVLDLSATSLQSLQAFGLPEVSKCAYQKIT